MRDLHLLFLCLLFCISTAGFSKSAQTDYPWGHQLLYMHCILVPAAPDSGWLAYTGADFRHEKSLPMSGLGRTLFKVPMGIGYQFDPRIRMDALWDVLYHQEASSPWRLESGDVRLYSTIAILRSPALSLRFGTKLPNASNNYEAYELVQGGGLSGAGSDGMDFHVNLLAGWAFSRFVVNANAGFLLLESPVGISSQLDVFTGSIGMDYNASPRLRLRAEYNGSTAPRRFDEYSEAAIGARYVIRHWFAALRTGAGLNSEEDDYSIVWQIGYQQK